MLNRFSRWPLLLVAVVAAPASHSHATETPAEAAPLSSLLSGWLLDTGNGGFSLALPGAILHLDRDADDYRLRLERADDTTTAGTVVMTTGDGNTRELRIRSDDAAALMAAFGHDLFALLPDFVPRPHGTVALDATLAITPPTATSASQAKAGARPARLKAMLSSPGNRVLLQGTIGDPWRLREIALEAEVDMQAIRTLPAWPATWPAPQRVRASGTITGSAEQLDIRGLGIRLHGEHFEVRAEGAASAITTPGRGLDLAMNLEARNLAALPFPLIQSMPQDAALRLDGRVGLNADGTPALYAMNARAGDGAHTVYFAGDVTRLRKPAHFELRAHGALPDIGYLYAGAGFTTPVPVEFSATLRRDRGEALRAEDIRVTSLDPEVQGSISGTILDLKNSRQLELALHAAIDNPGRFLHLHALRSFTEQPATVELTVRDEPGGFAFRDITLSSGDNKMTGDLSWRRPSAAPGKPRLSGRVDFNRLHIGFGEPGRSEKRSRLLPERRLPWGTLLQNDLALELGADTLLLHKTKFKDSRVRLEAGGNRFTITSLAGTLAGHPVDAGFTLRLDKDAPAAEFRMATIGESGKGGSDGKDAAPPTDKGHINMDVQLSGHGYSMADIAATASGTLYLDVSDARVSAGALHLFGADLLTQLADFLVPRPNSDERSTLECAVLWLDFEDGVTTPESKILARTNRTALAGEGTINLKDETLDIDLQTKAHTGLGISPAAVTNIYKLGGTLAKPRITGDSGKLLRAGASLGVAIITGGASLAARGLFDRMSSIKNNCKELMEQRAATSPRAPPAP